MPAHITRSSVISGQTMYYAGDNHWTESFDDRKVYSTKAQANARIAPTTQRIGGRDVSNTNGAMKNATAVTE